MSVMKKQRTEIDVWAEMVSEAYLNEWNDTHIPRGRVAHHATGKPKKYWVAVDDNSEILTNYSQFVNQSLQLTEIGGNKNPTFSTIDPAKVKELAKRCIKKWPDKYVFIGVDDTSHGVMTGKDHLRASVRYYWNPNYRMWNDADMDESECQKLKESVSKDEVLGRAVEHLLYFAAGKGNQILKDDEWMADINNCINEAIILKAYKPEGEAKKLLDELNRFDED